MSPEAEALDKELRHMHEVSPFSTIKVALDNKKPLNEIIGEWIFQGLSVLILMAIGGAITVGYLSYAGWIQFASL